MVNWGQVPLNHFWSIGDRSKLTIFGQVGTGSNCKINLKKVLKKDLKCAKIIIVLKRNYLGV